MATIRAKQSRQGLRYHVQVRLHGFPNQTATFERKTDARKWAQDTESAIRQGRHFRSLEARRHTVADLIDRYIAEVLGSREGGDCAKRTAQLLWWRKNLGAYSLADLTPGLIAECRDRLRRGESLSGKPIGPAAQVRYLAALSHALSTASREWEWIEVSPATRVRRPTEPSGRVRFLDHEECQRLLEASRQSSDRRLYPLIFLALSTGARQGELMNLRWRDINLGGGFAILHKTKNGQRRRLTLTATTVEVLRRLAAIRRFDNDRVFASVKGRTRFPRNVWNRALRTAGLTDFRFHDLRHTAASYLAMSGATLAEIAEVLGHRTLAMVKRYAHLSEQHTSSVVSRMNAKFLADAAAT